MRFLLGIIVKQEVEDPPSHSERIIERFRADREVPEHVARCPCIDWRSWKLASFIADREYPNLDEQFASIPSDERPSWELFFKEWRIIRDDVFRRHRVKNKTEPSCEWCGGAGKRRTTSNPDGKLHFARFEYSRPVPELTPEDAPSIYVTPDCDGPNGIWTDLERMTSRFTWNV